MGRKVKIKQGHNRVVLPNGHAYMENDEVVLTDAQFASMTETAVQDVVLDLGAAVAPGESSGSSVDPAIITSEIQESVAAHEAKTTSIHGIADTTTLATQESVDAAQAAVDAHEAQTANVHGIADPTALATQESVAAHEAKTANVHGIADPTALATQASVDAAQASVAAHEAKTANVHGIANSSALATQAGLASLQAELDAHELATRNIHGIADTATLGSGGGGGGITPFVRILTDLEVVNTSTRTAIAAVNIPAGKIPTDGLVVLEWFGDYLNNTGANQPHNFALAWNGTQVFQQVFGSTFSGTTRRSIRVTVTLLPRGATSVAFLTLVVGNQATSLTGITSISNGLHSGLGESNEFTINTAVSNDLELRYQHDTANANLAIRRRFAYASVV